MSVVYDPIKLWEKVREVVCKGEARKYFRFRATRYYGGIATGDVVGCNLKCCYCYVNQPRERPAEIGKFYMPNEVASILVRLAERNGFNKVRLSGGEPTLCRKHLLKLLSLIPPRLTFILETNGIILGYDKSYVKALSKFKNVLVRVSLKGCTPQEFSRITGAKPDFFKVPVACCELLPSCEGSFLIH